MMHLPCNIQKLLPHEPPMLLVEDLLERNKISDDDDSALIGATVPVDGPFIEQGVVIPEYYIELAAQSIAAVDGFDSMQEGTSASEGFLVGVDNFEVSSLVKSGDRLQVAVKKEFSFNGVQIFDSRIMANTTVVSCGKIRIWLNTQKSA